MPIRPSNISHHSHSSKGKSSISNFIAETSTPYLLPTAEEESYGDDSDFSFEIEEEIAQQAPKTNNSTKKQTNKDIYLRGHNSSSSSSQPKSRLHPVVSRDDQRTSLKSKVEHK